MRTRRGLCYSRVVEDKNMRVVKRRRDFAAEQVSHRKRSRNSSDIAGKRDLFDSLPYDLVISILCKVSPSDLANVLLTYVLLFFLMKNKFWPFHRSLNRNYGLNFISDMWKTLKTIFFFFKRSKIPDIDGLFSSKNRQQDVIFLSLSLSFAFAFCFCFTYLCLRVVFGSESDQIEFIH